MTPYKEVYKDIHSCRSGKGVEDHLFLYEVFTFPYAVHPALFSHPDDFYPEQGHCYSKHQHRCFCLY